MDTRRQESSYGTNVEGSIMQVGDLVKIDGWDKDIGIIIRCIPGWAKIKVVVWMDGIQCSYPEKNLKAVKCK